MRTSGFQLCAILIMIMSQQASACKAKISNVASSISSGSSARAAANIQKARRPRVNPVAGGLGLNRKGGTEIENIGVSRKVDVGPASPAKKLQEKELRLKTAIDKSRFSGQPMPRWAKKAVKAKEQKRLEDDIIKSAQKHQKPPVDIPTRNSQKSSDAIGDQPPPPPPPLSNKQIKKFEDARKAKDAAPDQPPPPPPPLSEKQIQKFEDARNAKNAAN